MTHLQIMQVVMNLESIGEDPHEKNSAIDDLRTRVKTNRLLASTEYLSTKINSSEEENEWCSCGLIILHY